MNKINLQDKYNALFFLSIKTLWKTISEEMTVCHIHFLNYLHRQTWDFQDERDPYYSNVLLSSIQIARKLGLKRAHKA